MSRHRRRRHPRHPMASNCMICAILRYNPHLPDRCTHVDAEKRSLHEQLMRAGRIGVHDHRYGLAAS